MTLSIQSENNMAEYILNFLKFSNLDLTFDLVIVTMTFKILSGLFLGFHKV